MIHIRRKPALIALALIGVLAVAVGAYAYFSSTGAGTGTGSVGSTQAVTLHGTVTNTLYPGTSSPVTFTVDNPSSGNQHVGTIHMASVTADAGHSSCAVAAFTMPDVVANQVFTHANGQAVTATGTMTMADTGVSQDTCQGATLTLNLTSN